MDIQIRYQQEKLIFSGVQSYQDLLQEILLKYPVLININLSYEDEEGDTIQVSNTSDLIAITDLSRVVLQMEAQINQQKVEELNKAKRVAELKQKRLEEQKRKKEELNNQEIMKVQFKIQELNQEKAQIELQATQKINELKNQLQQLNNFQLESLPEFRQVFYDSKILDLVREKESELLLLEEKKGFDTQLKLVQKVVEDSFGQLFTKRILQHKENHSKWLDNKHKLIGINSNIQQQEMKKQSDLLKLNEMLNKNNKQKEYLLKIKGELNLSQENDDQF